MTTATAQKQQKHELSIYALGGYSSLNYTLNTNGSKSSGDGIGFGLNYTYNITPSFSTSIPLFSIVTGIEILTYSAEASLNNVMEDYTVEEEEIDLFQFSYLLPSYRETQDLTIFSIPVMAQYSMPVGSGSMRFYASGGFKIGFPLSAKTDIMPGTADTEGYVAYENITYVILPTHGFDSNISLPDINRDIDLGFSATLALETGVRFNLGDKIGLYTGVYFDYGLNNIQKINDKHPLEYDMNHLSESAATNEKPFLYHSVLNTGFVNKVNLMSIGLKVKIGVKL
jgi:hypothetical protein